MFKYLFYVSVLLSATSSHLFAMDTSTEIVEDSSLKATLKKDSKSLTESTLDSDKKLITKSTPPVLQMFAKEAGERELKKSEISFYFRNSIPSLERADLKEKIEIKSNTIPYTILNPLEHTETPTYLADGHATLCINLMLKNGEVQQSRVIPLPLNTSYGEPLKVAFQEAKRKEMDISIQFRGTAFPSGQIIDGKWAPQGEPEFISTSLWCPIPPTDSVYVDITSDFLKATKK